MNALKRLSPVCLLLVAVGCGQSTGFWTEQMKSPDSVTRLHAVYALRERVKEPATVVPVLTEALADEDTFIRRDAAKALGKFGPAATGAVPPLLARLRDPEPSVRKAAAQALKQIDPASLPN